MEIREDLNMHKTRMNGLSCGVESMTICSAVLIQYQRVTDGQTDRRTDVQPISITCFSIADARKSSVGALHIYVIFGRYAFGKETFSLLFRLNRIRIGIWIQDKFFFNINR